MLPNNSFSELCRGKKWPWIQWFEYVMAEKHSKYSQLSIILNNIGEQNGR